MAPRSPAGSHGSIRAPLRAIQRAHCGARRPGNKCRDARNGENLLVGSRSDTPQRRPASAPITFRSWVVCPGHRPALAASRWQIAPSLYDLTSLTLAMSHDRRDGPRICHPDGSPASIRDPRDKVCTGHAGSAPRSSGSAAIRLDRPGGRRSYVAITARGSQLRIRPGR